MRSAVVGIALFAAAPALLAASPGCGLNCNAAYYPSGATLTLHLPSAGGVAAPETVVVCRGSTCLSATLPAVGPNSPAPVDLVPLKIFGWVSVGAGGVRVLSINWTANDIGPGARDDYRLTVTDNADAVTGLLAGTVSYVADEPNGPGCGDRWSAELHD